MDDQQKPGPSGQKSGMPGNFDDILRYFNIVRDDHDESEIDEKPFDDQWENDGSGFLFEPNDDFNFNFNRPEFDANDVAEIDRLLANYMDNSGLNDDEIELQEHEIFVNPNLYKLKFNVCIQIKEKILNSFMVFFLIKYSHFKCQ